MTSSIDQAAPEALACASTPAPSISLEGPFADMGLATPLLQAIAQLGYTQPTVVQQKAIPQALAAKQGYVDLMVSSQTGSGKTAAFLLPVLHALIEAHEARKAAEQAEFEQRVAQALAQGEAPPKKPKRKNPLNRRFGPATPGALVLCPTRELATQVARDAIDLLQHSRGVRVASVIGGLPYHKQIAQLQNAALVVATPGRLLDLQRGGQLQLDSVQCLVVDEADRMLDLGFAEDLEAIHHLTAERRQTMMFSATFAPRIQQLGMRVMHEGGAHVQRIEVASAQEKHADITQKLFWADSSEHKRELLDAWLRDTGIDQAIVFASTQIECDALAQDLQEAGFSAAALHGAMPQSLRNRRLAALRDGRVHILVATDVAARGIDVPSISHVFNYGLPMKSEDYTHRIGRTGRAGRHGLAISFAEFRDRRRIHEIEQFTRQPFEIDSLPGLEPRQRFTPWRAAPAGKGRGDGRGARGDGRGFRSEGRGFRGEGRSFRGEFRSEFRGEGRGEFRGEFRGQGREFRNETRGEFRDFRGESQRQRGDFRHDRSEHRNDRGEGRRFDNRFENRSEGRSDKRFEGRRFEGRFEGRAEGRTERRFEARPEGRFAKSGQSRSENRSGNRTERRFETHRGKRG